MNTMSTKYTLNQTSTIGSMETRVGGDTSGERRNSQSMHDDVGGAGSRYMRQRVLIRMHAYLSKEGVLTCPSSTVYPITLLQSIVSSISTLLASMGSTHMEVAMSIDRETLASEECKEGAHNRQANATVMHVVHEG